MHNFTAYQLLRSVVPGALYPSHVTHLPVSQYGAISFCRELSACLPLLFLLVKEHLPVTHDFLQIKPRLVSFLMLSLVFIKVNTRQQKKLSFMAVFITPGCLHSIKKPVKTGFAGEKPDVNFFSITARNTKKPCRLWIFFVRPHPCRSHQDAHPC